MGNKNSTRRNVIIRDKTCIICFEKIKGNCVSCYQCRVLSHHNCYFLWNNENNFTCFHIEIVTKATAYFFSSESDNDTFDFLPLNFLSSFFFVKLGLKFL